ncbi:MAG TPA: hypothetical protein VHX38_25840 [Pseudonocardiaceae bacterium]|jgi:hypothetical protein|nr:hypothetical protein [Pseudonocardiaceae bacterium]
MKQGLGSIVGRIVAVIAGLLVLGIALKLIMGILSPILPVGLMQIVSGGWNALFGIVGPALPATTAVLILGALCWAFIGKRR